MCSSFWAIILYYSEVKDNKKFFGAPHIKRGMVTKPIPFKTAPGRVVIGVYYLIILKCKIRQAAVTVSPTYRVGCAELIKSYIKVLT